MSIVSRRYRTAFVLDPSKFRRIVDVLEKGFEEFGDNYTADFEINFKNNKSLLLKTLDETLQLDNTKKNPIKGVQISYTLTGGNSCHIIFQEHQEINSGKYNIFLQVQGADNKWVGSISSALEEQIERTLSSGIFYWTGSNRTGDNQTVYKDLISSSSVTGRFFLLFVTFMITMATVMVNVRTPFRPSSTTMWLTAEQIALFKERSENLSSLEDKNTLVFDVLKAQLENIAPQPQPSILPDFSTLFPRNLSVAQFVFLILSPLTILGAIVYLFVVCYPRAVFNWGDYGEWYAAIVERRKTIWTVVIFAIIFGIISNLFIFGITPFFS